MHFESSSSRAHKRAGRGEVLALRSLALACAALGVLACSSQPSGPEETFADGLDKLERRIEQVIDDPDRVGELRTVLAGLETTFQEHAVALRGKQRELREAAREYATTDEQLEAKLMELRGEVEGLRLKIQKAHYELRDLVSEEEWSSILNP